MGSTGRHRRVRPRDLSRVSDLGRGRYGLAAVCGVAVVSLLGASQPVWTIDVPADGRAAADAGVRAALAAAAPDSLLPTVVQSAGGPGESRATAAGGDDIPGPALEAYQRAASVLAEAAPACELSWTLLAGVGRVESDHGRWGGAVLGDDGVSRSHIVGVALDGAGQVAEVSDTDDGELDGDGAWDRAVGPMQFLPTTWALAGVDGDGDGVRNPHDIDDAALAAGVYLCAGGGDLSQEQDMRAALLRYNPSTSYAALVMSYEQRYRTGRFAADSGPALTSRVPVAERISTGARDTGSRVDRAVPVPATRPAPAAKSGKVELAAKPEPAGAAPATPAPATPAPAGDAEQATPPAPLPEPDPAPAPVPDTPPATEAQETGSTAGPADVVETERVTVTGMLTTCDAWFCLDEQPLLPGDPAVLDQPAEADLDGDGEVEISLAELTGLVDRNVVVVVDKQETGWLVYEIHELMEALTP